MSAPGYLIETGWREDLQMLVVVLFVAAVIAIICEAVVCFTRPGSKVGDWFVLPMLTAIVIFIGAGVFLGVEVAKTPMNEAYWKTYEFQGQVLAADYANTATGGQVPVAIMDPPNSANAAGMWVNMSSNALSEYIGQDVKLTCTLVQTKSGAMDHLCTFAEVYQEASA